MRRRSDRLRPERLAPLFVLTALIHAAAVLTRFDLVRDAVPQVVHGALFCAQLPLLLIGGYYESRLDHRSDLPVWMQIRSRPVKWSLTLAFTYFAIHTSLTLDLELLDPTPPAAWPQTQRALWFLGFSFGMFFANYLTTTRFVVPVLRLLGAALRWLPAPLALLLLAVLGLALGLATLIADAHGPGVADELRGRFDALLADPEASASMIAAAILGPTVLASLGHAGKASAEN